MARKTKQIEIASACTCDWCIPLFGNIHSIPYGTIFVKGKVDGMDVSQHCKTHGDKVFDHTPQYIIFQGVRFIVRNVGSMYNPNIKLTEWKKEKVGKRWVYTDRYEG